MKSVNQKLSTKKISDSGFIDEEIDVILHKLLEYIKILHFYETITISMSKPVKTIVRKENHGPILQINTRF